MDHSIKPLVFNGSSIWYERNLAFGVITVRALKLILPPSIFLRIHFVQIESLILSRNYIQLHITMQMRLYLDLIISDPAHFDPLGSTP